ncbi:hypothetical protein PACTADRAFT_50059, partial [Pachysolen tannophilus NRRL Y-2460]
MAAPHLLHKDKEFEKYNYLRQNLSNSYKFMNKNSLKWMAIFVVIIPVSGVYFCYSHEGKYNHIGSKRTKPLWDAEFVPR